MTGKIPRASPDAPEEQRSKRRPRQRVRKCATRVQKAGCLFVCVSLRRPIADGANPIDGLAKDRAKLLRTVRAAPVACDELADRHGQRWDYWFSVQFLPDCDFNDMVAILRSARIWEVYYAENLQHELAPTGSGTLQPAQRSRSFRATLRASESILTPLTVAGIVDGIEIEIIRQWPELSPTGWQGTAARWNELCDKHPMFPRVWNYLWAAISFADPQATERLAALENWAIRPERKGRVGKPVSNGISGPAERDWRLDCLRPWTDSIYENGAF